MFFGTLTNNLYICPKGMKNTAYLAYFPRITPLNYHLSDTFPSAHKTDFKFSAKSHAERPEWHIQSSFDHGRNQQKNRPYL